MKSTYKQDMINTKQIYSEGMGFFKISTNVISANYTNSAN